MAVFHIPHDLIATLNARLIAIGVPAGERHAALATLAVIVAQLETQSFACRANVVELADQVGLDVAGMVAVMKLLHGLGVVTAVQRHGRRTVAVVPPGVRLPGRPRAYPLPDQVAATA